LISEPCDLQIQYFSSIDKYHNQFVIVADGLVHTRLLEKELLHLALLDSTFFRNSLNDYLTNFRL